MLVISGFVFDRFFQEISKQEKGSNKNAEPPLVVLVMMGRDSDLASAWKDHKRSSNVEKHMFKKRRVGLEKGKEA